MKPFEMAQRNMIREYIRVVYGRGEADVIPYRFHAHITSKVRNLIRRYGETGFGDKPESMDTVEYWLSHLKPYTNLMRPSDAAAIDDWTGKTVCFSGRMPNLSKAEAGALVVRAGGQVTNSMTKATTHLVCGGDFDTKKVFLALERDIPMMLAYDFSACFPKPSAAAGRKRKRGCAYDE